MDIQERVAFEVARAVETRQQPEGVSVMINWPAYDESDPEQESMLQQIALMIAAEQYNIDVTGTILYVGLNDLGPGLHEVVCEVGSKSDNKIVISRIQNNR